MKVFEIGKLGTLPFGFNVKGDFKEVSSTRLVLKRDGFGVMVEGSVGKDEVKFDLSGLNDFMPSGVYEMKMEVVLDGDRYFSPVTEQVRLTSKPKIEATTRPTDVMESRKEPSVSVTIKQTAMEDWVQLQEAKGFNVIVNTEGVPVSYDGMTKMSEFEG